MADYQARKEKVTLFQKLHQELAEIIESTPPGEKLKSEPELAASLQVSRTTLREAMRSFESQGLIRRRQGVGTFVIEHSQNIETGLETLESIETQASRLGLDVKMGYLGINRVSAGKEYASKMDVAEDDTVIEISRVIWVADHPVAYLVDVLPEGVLSEEDLEQGFTGSVLDLLIRKKDLHLGYSKTFISACHAEASIAKKIQLQRSDVIQRFDAYLFEESGRMIDYSISYFAPGFFKFHVNRKINI